RRSRSAPSRPMSRARTVCSSSELAMIIDCHGHYTTAPKELGDYRDQQKADLKKNPQHQSQKGTLSISDDQLRQTSVPRSRCSLSCAPSTLWRNWSSLIESVP